MRIALDAMGGDHGPRPALEGAYAAVRRFGIEVVLVGRARYLERLLAAQRIRSSLLHIVDARDVVTMHDAPKDSLRKKHSSLAVACDLVQRGDCDALVSAGNTGAVYAHTLMKWRALAGVRKPAIATLLPTHRDPVVVIDAGANVDCKPRQLVNFAIMGHVYAREVLHRKNPRIGLLNIGEEETKGNELTLETSRFLRQTPLNYLGHAEGRDVPSGDFDVVVCDGFVGNIVLKTAEGCAQLILSGIKREVRKSLLTMIGAVAMSPAIRRFRRHVDYEEYGGAPLLGLNGVCIICHGSSNNKAFKNAIRVAREAVNHRLTEHIQEELKRSAPAIPENNSTARKADGPDPADNGTATDFPSSADSAVGPQF
jgi:glycerol-3-phosphate acyltransferase PlsX